LLSGASSLDLRRVLFPFSLSIARGIYCEGKPSWKEIENIFLAVLPVRVSIRLLDSIISTLA